MKLLVTLTVTLLALTFTQAAPIQSRFLFLDDLNNLVHEVVNTIGDGIDQAVHTMGTVVSDVGDVLGVGTAANTLTGLVNNVVDQATHIVGGAVNQLADVVKSTADGATLGIGNNLMSMVHLK